MPRTFAPRVRRESSAHKLLAVAAVAFVAFCAVFGFGHLSPQVVRSQDAAPSGAPRTLSLEERVAHQRAVDEVYWRHTVWPQENATPKPSLDEVMPREATRAKVEETMRKSDALARLWNRPVSAEQLQAELNRMARETRQPEVLRELWRALGDDPFLIAEVLARPALVDRLARTSFDAEEKAAPKGASESGATQASFDAWWESASRQYAVADAEADGGFNYQLAAIGAAGADDTWSPTQAMPVSTGSAAVWTGAEVIIWGGTTQYGGRTNAGARYNPATDTWTSISTVGAPSPRSGHAAHWTGTEFLVWGGVIAVNCGGTGPCRNTTTNTGGRYNPLTDTWTPTSTIGAPSSTSGIRVWTGSKLFILGSPASNIYDPASDTWTQTPGASSNGSVGNRAIFTGKEIFTWGGIDNTTGTRGAIYNLETNTWRQPNNFNAPSERNGFSMVWTGTEVVVWGGYEGNNITLNTGGRYNPATDTWTPTSTAGAPAPRTNHVAVWTGSEMVVHGGDLHDVTQTGATNTGGRYNPANDSWTATSTTGSPGKAEHVAVWTGTEVFVWGGRGPTGSFSKVGARFNPSNDTWTPVNSDDSPLYLQQGVWTGAEMLVWGQNSLCGMCTSVGGRYDPATNVWRPMNLSGAPTAGSAGYTTNIVWTGKEMLVWGPGSRGRYNPLTDTWAAISSAGAPAWGYTVVWSGKEMIVWGSGSQENDDQGGRYNPETDTWRPTSTVGAPTGRYMHTAVWSGSEMIVWGGLTSGVAGQYNTGGRYNPETDTWRPTSTAGAPEARTHHTAVWAGSEMIVWGGMTGQSGTVARVNTGGRYDPATDTWTPTATAGAPEAREDHRAIWTGSQMIVWGGIVKGVTGGDGTYTGARYNPSTDVWTTTSTLRAPSKRSHHVQVWTGKQMIVWGGISTEGAATHGAVYNAPGALRAGNLPPAVSLTAPAGGTSYQSGDTVQFAAEVSDPDGAVTTVRFYANGHLVGTDRQAPFAFAWGEVRGGNYALMAVATDDGNAEARSAEVNISVAPSTAPPACVLTAPADGSTYSYGASVRMEATMTPNRDRAIARVEFLVDGQMVTYYEPPTYNPPYWHLYTANVAGARSLAARCTDNLGGVTTSSPRVINVEEQGFSISGQLLEASNSVPVANVRIRLDGPAGTAPRYQTTTVGGMGNYYFGGLKPGQTYKITPEAGAWRWSHEDGTYPAISRSYTQQHYYGTRVGVAITGKVIDAGGNPVYPATVYLSGSKNAYTNVSFDGTYFFYGLVPGGTYTVQPYKNLYAFGPSHRTFENLSADQTADFTGAPQTATHVIAGRVVDSAGTPLVGYRVRLETSRVPGTKYRTTDAQGRFSFDNLAAGENCHLWPEDFTYAYGFTPTTRLYTNLGQNVSDADFVATPRTVSGQVVQSGTGVAGVVVNLSGPQAGTVTTGADGRYAFNGVTVRGDYTVSASKTGYAFTPNQHAIKDLKEDVTAANFAAAPAPGAPINFALASNGGVATASSSYSSAYPAASLVNGDRRGLNWNAGGGWNDATGGAYPDWVEVAFNGQKSVGEVSVFTLQDSPAAPGEPTEQTAFTKYGVTGFEVRYWTGSAWAAVPGGSVTGNNKVWRKLTFSPVSTTKIRVVVTGALAGYSRLVEVEAWGTGGAAVAPAGRTNVALSSNGGVATASSSYSSAYPAASVINGDRRGLNWNSGGGWNDATSGAHPDWVVVAFNGEKTIEEIDVFTLQDSPSAPVEPTEAQTFTRYGVTGMQVEYWAGSAWAAVPGGLLPTTDRVWNKFTFAPIKTTKIRVVVNHALANYSRLVEVEAWQPAAAQTSANHALAANGGVATASSSYSFNYPAASLNNGDRRGLKWNAGGGWNDATGGTYPDWVEVSFSGEKSVTEVHVFTLQDDPAAPAEPAEAQTFTKYGVTGMRVEYWTGGAWAEVAGGAVTGNDRVWRRFSFPAVATRKIRVVVTGALAGYSRLTEIEAY